MIMFIKMSSGWHGTDFALYNSEDRNDMLSHVENGSIVAVAEDIETFADEMDIDIDNIKMVN